MPPGPKILDAKMTQLTHDQKRILARYADGPYQLDAVISGLSEADFDLALAPHTWTIRQYTHHIVDGDDLWKTAIKAALGRSRGLLGFGWYWDIPQDTWTEHWNYASRAIEPSLALFRANRRHITQLVQQLPNAWERNALITMPDGETSLTTVGYVIEMQADHVVAHLSDIQEIRQRHDSLHK